MGEDEVMCDTVDENASGKESKYFYIQPLLLPQCPLSLAACAQHQAEQLS